MQGCGFSFGTYTGIPMKVSSVWVFPNEMVVVFGPDGQQICELQGRFDDVKESIEKAVDEYTEIHGWFVNGVQKGGRECGSF